MNSYKEDVTKRFHYLFSLCTGGHLVVMWLGIPPPTWWQYENSLLFVFSCTGMLFLRISLFHFHSWYTEFVICSSSKEIYASIVLPYVVASMIHKKMKQRGSAVIWQYRSHTYCFLLSILICSRFFSLLGRFVISCSTMRLGDDIITCNYWFVVCLLVIAKMMR